ncbi:hypothetical protein [Streptomyces sp. NPDC102437]|uniref:hypothetical protein n=1 Tax=Streptomyces sp. NPDC102437 TaxID=3366175 RepID=UPI0038199565
MTLRCGWMSRWAGRSRRWGAPELLALKPPHPVPTRKSRSTEPRPLAAFELAGRECWRCGEPPVEGTHAWDDRGPFQLLSTHTFTCTNGHGWRNSTDGG